MKRALDFGVSDPLTLGMVNPIAARLQTLGHARPTTWGSRSLAFITMAFLTFSTAPMTVAESAADKNLPHVLTVIPDMTDLQIADLQARMDKVTSGQADKELLTEFMRQNRNQLVAKYYADDVLANVTLGYPMADAKEMIDAMPELLARCKAERTENLYVMRTSFSSGAASVSCNTGNFSMPPRPVKSTKK